MTTTETPKSLDEQLCEICGQGNLDEVKKLVEQGANPNAKIHKSIGWDSYTFSPLHYALGMKKSTLNIPIVQFLLEHGADINVKMSAEGWNTRGSVSESGFERIVSLVLQGSDVGLFRLALKYGGNPNTVISESHETMRSDSSKRCQLIHNIVGCHRPDILKVLLELGANSNAESTSSYQSEYGANENTVQTPLHLLLTAKGPFDFLSAGLLVKYGCDVNMYQSNLDQVKTEKIDNGVTDPRNNDYDPGLITYRIKITPLQLAIKNENISAILFLLSNGVNIRCPYFIEDKEHSLEVFMEKYSNLDKNKMEYMKMVLKGWKPELNKYYPEAFKVIVMNVLLCFNRTNLLPKEIVFTILGYLSHYPVDCELLEKYLDPLPEIKNYKGGLRKIQ